MANIPINENVKISPKNNEFHVKMYLNFIFLENLV
jgi:hypothetical protein